MPRYIDANNIVYWVRHTSRDGLEDDIRKVAFKDAIERIPIADVQEVKHGHWELIKNDRSKCSECGFQRNIETQFGWKFCPMCGADMGVYKDNEQIY